MLGKLNDAVLSARAAGPAGADALEVSATLLRLNPEVYTAWNHRKEALEPVLSAGGARRRPGKGLGRACSNEISWAAPVNMSLPSLPLVGESAVEAAAKELQLTQEALMRNPKSYSAWHHRKWVLGYGLSSLEAELVLVEMLLDMDSRNFHGWAYRRFVAQARVFLCGGGNFSALIYFQAVV